jgi:uncharacterized protein YbaA (DUF1428 family)
VRGDMCNAAATSRLVAPPATRAHTSRSRAVSTSSFGVRSLRRPPAALGVGRGEADSLRAQPDQESSMPYIEGFVAAVPTAHKDEYVEHARQASTYFKDLGATRVIECWGDDVPKGEVTDFYKAAQVKEDETPIFSWIEYPDKATRDAANEKMSQDPEMSNMEMPFDSSRMFWGGFEQVVNE